MDCSLQAGKDISKNPPFVYFTRVPDIAETVEAGLDKFRNKDRLIEASSVVNNYDGGSLDSGTVHMGVAVQHETLQAMLVGFLVGEDEVDQCENPDDELFLFRIGRKATSDVTSTSIAEMGNDEVNVK